MQIMQTEGIIKYKCENQLMDAVTDAMIADINLIRTLLFDLKLIGIDYRESVDGIGFGNISKRIINNQFTNNQFVISGSGTGNKRILNAKDFSTVVNCDIQNNFLHSKGLCNASSESLSHFAVYKSLKNINFVIHIHNLELWNYWKNKTTTTDENAQYGTPEMANSIIDCVKQFNETHEPKAVVMGGHIEGMLFFGEDLAATFLLILDFLNAINK